MKLSKHKPSPNRLTPEQKQLIESHFWGEKSKEFTDAKGVVLNMAWQISELTGIGERQINRYVNFLITEKIKKTNDTE